MSAASNSIVSSSTLLPFDLTTSIATTNTIAAALLPCYLVNNLTRNTEEQCKFIIDNDCLETEGTIDYVYLVYCEMGHKLRFTAIALIVFLVIVLFLNLSTVADEFLCPSLLTVAKNLRMSDSLAGVTLLAFGNGCPDIFSSLAAASSNRPELIVGELLGAGIFCTSIVAGLVFISTEFKPAQRPLIRDGTFYLLAVCLIWYYCSRGEITFYGSLAFIIIYVIYLVVALGDQFIQSRLSGNYPMSEAHSGAVQQAKRNSDPIMDENAFIWRRGSHGIVADILNQQKQQQQQQQQQQRVSTITLPTTTCRKTQTQMTIDLQLVKPVKPWTCSCVTHADKSNSEKNQMNLEPRSVGDSKLLGVQCFHSEEVGKPVTSIDFTLDEWDHFLSHVNPIEWESWNEARLSGKLAQILRAPLRFVTILTVPVVDFDKPNNNWCRLLNSLHCFMIPSAIIFLTNWDPSSANDEANRSPNAIYDVANDSNDWLVPLIKLVLLLPGTLLAIFVFRTSEAFKAPKYHAAFAYFGFAMSVMWIYLLATEIISLLKTVGIIFSMTDTAIGLGVLAWGNSLGDIVANLSLAEAGYPRMALGASIGAPLLNLLLGFGLSFTLELRPGKSQPVDYSPTVTLLCSTLSIILIVLMLSVLIPSERSRKPFGYVLISGYANILHDSRLSRVRSVILSTEQKLTSSKGSTRKIE